MSKVRFERVDGSIAAPKGFLCAGVHCDIKRLGTGKGSDKGKKRDLAVIVSEVPASVAGMFTTNQVCAAPVQISRQRASRATAQAIVVNSGNANACTGEAGKRDALQMTDLTARLLKLDPERVLVASTGRIGVRLPMRNVRRGIEEATAILKRSEDHARQVAEAIMTSDTRTKECAVELRVDGKAVRIGGVCKGAGMIQPRMSLNGKMPAAHATMLAFLTTDAAVPAPALRRALREAVSFSFNRITVDGDTSTNDTVIALANGFAGVQLSEGRVRPWAQFREALSFVCLDLAKQIVKDGEGVSRFVTVRISGARTSAEADAAARAVANSPLVKTSWCGGDPNWGRILGALGYSSARVDERRLDVGYSLPQDRQIHFALKGGAPSRTSLTVLKRVVAAPEFDLHIRLNLGEGSATIFAADLTEAYVDFNKGE